MSIILDGVPKKPRIKTRICFINNSIVKHIPDLDIIKRCNTYQLPGGCYVLKMESITSKEWRAFQIRKTYSGTAYGGSAYTSTTACATVNLRDGGKVYFNNSSFDGGRDELIEFAEVVQYAFNLLEFIDEGTDTHDNNSV